MSGRSTPDGSKTDDSDGLTSLEDAHNRFDEVSITSKYSFEMTMYLRLLSNIVLKQNKKSKYFFCSLFVTALLFASLILSKHRSCFNQATGWMFLPS